MYDAFISYSHAKDKLVASALQRTLQKLGKPWYQRRALRIFRDDTSLAATPHLWPAIEQALQNSRYLLVVASPEFAHSKWCEREVASWVAQKSIDTLLIAVTDGELIWNETEHDFVWNDQTPLPAILKGQFRAEPKWIDLRAWRTRPSQQEVGFTEVAADLGAAIHGIAKDDLVSQELKQQRRALTLAWSAAAILLMLTATAGWQWTEAEGARRVAVASEHAAIDQRRIAEQERSAAQAQRQRAERNLALARASAESLVVKIVQGLRDVQGVPVERIRQILETVQNVVDELVASAPHDPQLQRIRANMLNEFALLYRLAGDYERARRAAEQALAIMRRLADDEPENAARQRDVSVVLERLGDALLAAGATEAALAAYEEALRIARKLAEAEPQRLDLQRDLYVSLEKTGDARILAGDREGGRALLEEGLATIRGLTVADPTNLAWQRDLTVILNKIGDLQLAAGGQAEASVSYQEGLEVARRLVRSAPGNLRFHRDLSISLERVGLIRLRAGDRVGALAAFEEALEISQRLVAADPNNTQYQTSLVIMLYKVSTASEGARAIDALRTAIALADRLEREGKLTATQRPWPRLLRQALSKIAPETAGS
jgi:tetratricopeptide (TPR) repeat protein